MYNNDKCSEHVTGNKNDHTEIHQKTKIMWCHYMKKYIQQRQQTPKYHTNEAKHNKAM